MKTITFYKNADDLKNMASYIAQLVREGLSFEMRDLQDRVEVVVMGGF